MTKESMSSGQEWNKENTETQMSAAPSGKGRSPDRGGDKNYQGRQGHDSRDRGGRGSGSGTTAGRGRSRSRSRSPPRHHRRSRSRSRSWSHSRSRSRSRHYRDHHHRHDDRPYDDYRRGRRHHDDYDDDRIQRRNGNFDDRRDRQDDRMHYGPSNNNRNHRNQHNGNGRNDHPKSKPKSNPKPKPNQYPDYHVVKTPKDDQLGDVKDDPRGEDPTKRITKKASSRGNGRNTESFDPASTLVRPDLRILVGDGSAQKFTKPLKHDDVVIVPNLFGKEEDWSLYYKLVEEMRQVQAKGDVKGSEWISWHEGAHLICKNPKGSPTFTKIVDRLCDYFHIKKESTGTRFNWYRDSSDWKPFHHDSAAFNPQRAKNQNITVGVSFGATRELAFIRAEALQNEEKVRLYFPQTNNGVFSFGRDANILWKHGVNALAPKEQDGKGRISIVLWGLAQEIIEEEGSPPLLGSDGRGPHANNNNNNNNNNRNRQRRNNKKGGRNNKQRS